MLVFHIRQFKGLDFCPAYIFKHQEMPKATSNKEMHQQVCQKVYTQKLPHPKKNQNPRMFHVKEAFSNWGDEKDTIFSSLLVYQYPH